MALFNVVEACREDDRLWNTVVADLVSEAEGLRIAKSKAQALLSRKMAWLEGRAKGDRKWFQDRFWIEESGKGCRFAVMHSDRFNLPHMVAGWRLDLV